jgi:hypothetical protein
MEEDRMPKKIVTQELEGTRRRGRRRKRWKEEVERDLHVLGVRRWRELVADRKKMEGHYTKSNNQLLALVSFVFRDKILKHIHTLKC